MAPSCPVRRSPFASRSLAEHVARGALAAALIVAAFRYGDQSTPLLVLALAGAALMLRGCPTCWLVGLFGTLADRAARRDPGADRSAPAIPAE